MSNVFIAGVGGILLSGVFAALLMFTAVQARTGPADRCSFSSGYGVGAKACSDTTGLKASPRAVISRAATDPAFTAPVDRD